MLESKLLRIVKSFAKDEWKRARKFVLLETEESSDAHELYEYLSKYRYKLNSSHIRIDKAHEKLFPQKTRKGFQNVMSKLSNILEDYVRWDWLKRNKDEYDVVLMKGLTSRGLFHLFDLKANRFKKDIRNRDLLTLWDHLHLIQVYHAETYSDNPVNRIRSDELQQLLSHELVNFSSVLAQFYIIGMNYDVQHRKKDFSSYVSLLHQIPKPRRDLPVSKFMDKIEILIERDDTEHFTFVYQILSNNSDQLSPALRKVAFMTLLRREATLLKFGKTKTPDRLMKLYDLGMQTKILMVNNKIPYLRFANIINVFCVNGKLQEARNFITKYGALVIEENRESTLYLSNAQIIFYEDNYDEVIRLLSTHSFQKFIHTTRMRWLLLCSYFMVYKEDREFMDNVFRNFNNYVKSNEAKLTVTTYNGSLNLSRILKRLLTHDSGGTFLENELSSDNNIVFRSWLKKLAGTYKK